MFQQYLKYSAIILSLVSILNPGYSQNSMKSGINMGLKIGGSKLLAEIPNGFSQFINEFDNKTGFASAFEISKFITPRWEIGIETGHSTLNGNTFNPEFSAEGIQAGIPSEISEPVEYINKLFGQNLFFRCFFKPAGAESVFIPFIKAGGGYINYNSKYKYIDASDNDLLFGKGTEGYTKLSTPVFFLGTGFKTSLSSKFYMVTSVDFNMVNYDFLDVMHNFDLTENRMELIGIYTEFKIGIFYNFSKSGGENNKKEKNKSGGSSKTEHLPFSR